MSATRRAPAAVLLALALLFRLGYGLSSIFWTEDERQVYLIGLRSFARGDWPYFGADVVWTGSQLPGALQAMLVRAPLEIWPAPESPFVLLNLLSFGALALLAWYCGRRVPEVPRWLLWGALLTLPWTLNFSTHIVNTSYILPGAIVFFVGFFEASPAFGAGLLPLPVAWAMMGAGLLFLVQIHMSWVLLPAYALFAGIDLWRRAPRRLGAAAAGFLGGAALTGSLLLPTLLRFGLTAGGVDRTVQFQPQGAEMLLTIVARFLSFTAFETNRFLGLSTAERALVLWHQPWLLPFVLFVTLVGFAQPLALAAAWFSRKDRRPDWVRVKWLALATVLWIYASFFFSVRGPLAHAFYVVFPVAVVYACYGWRVLVAAPAAEPSAAGRSRRAWVTRIAAATLVSGVIMHAGLAIERLPRRSLYVDRALVQAAIDRPNDRFLGDRRDSLQEAQDRRPRPADGLTDVQRYEAAHAVHDLAIESAWAPFAGGRVSRFFVTIANTSSAAAWLDIRYVSRYRARDGLEVSRREGVIKQILQPGEARSWDDVTDGMVPGTAVTAELELVGAEKCIPARPDPIP